MYKLGKSTGNLVGKQVSTCESPVRAHISYRLNPQHRYLWVIKGGLQFV